MMKYLTNWIYTHKLYETMHDCESFMKKRPTQADVARLANVSQAMVSYVLNDNTTISIPGGTRQRILYAMETLGYLPNRTARSLRSSKTLTIAVIIPDITNPFYPAFERGIQDIADQHDYDVITYNTDGLAEKEQRVLQSLLDGRVDGVVTVLFHTSATALFQLLDHNILVVRLEATRKEAGERPLDNVYLDNIAAAQTAVEHLIQKGHRRIGMLAGHEGPTFYRLIGYSLMLQNAGLPADEMLIQTGDFNEQGGYQAMRSLLSLECPPTAVFAANDLMAMGAYLAIKEASLKIPEDVAVIGFDNIPTAKLVSPPLTTIDQFQHRAGQRAAEMLFERMDGNSPISGRSEELPHQLIVRAST
jgi:LacI family transcriptional regulator